MSQSSDLQSTSNHEYMKMFGDVVVGSFNHSGKRVKNSTATRSKEEVDKMQQQYLQHASRSAGATPIPLPVSNKSKSKKKSTKNVTSSFEELPEQPLIQQNNSSINYNDKPANKKKAVYLHNQLGKIKLFVEEVLNSEMAYCLIFSSEDDIIFVPNPAETLNFTDEMGDTSSVYYADTLFSWTDGVKKLMILFKSNEQQ